MNQKALRTLEFNKIIEQLKTYALTEPGQQRCAGLVVDRIRVDRVGRHDLLPLRPFGVPDLDRDR